MNICIVLNSSLNNSIFYKTEINKFDIVIAADGGANRCRQLDILPNYIIGDLDSITKQNLEYFIKNKTKIISAPSQNTLDFQEAIWLAETIICNEDLEEGLEKRKNKFLKNYLNNKKKETITTNQFLELTIFGGISTKEFDHTIGNLFLGISLSKKVLLKFVSISYIIYITKNSLELEGNKEDIVSIIPIQKTTGLTYKGLKYPVNNLDVEVGWLGSRNKLIEQKFKIEFQIGTLLIIKYN